MQKDGVLTIFGAKKKWIHYTLFSHEVFNEVVNPIQHSKEGEK